MFADDIKVILYVDFAAAILSAGVLVLCSWGIIKDRFEGKIFRALLSVVLAFTAFDAALYAIRGLNFPGFRFVAVLLWTVRELLLIISGSLWMIYANYRFYHSQDSIRRSFWKFHIPFYAAMAVVAGNLFFGFLFYCDAEGGYHSTQLLYAIDLLLFVYLTVFAVQIVLYQRKNRDLIFFNVWAFLTPVLLGGVVSIILPYSVAPLGLALGLTYIYTGIINEKSFQDRTTGYLNRLYMRYLKGEIEKGSFRCRSAMRYQIGREEDMERFAGILTPLLPKKCVIIRYSADTVIMFTEVTEKIALRMMEEDVRAAVDRMNAGQEGSDTAVTIDSMIKKKKETPIDFYQRFLEKVG
ncbi:MAG: hypothetical protein K6B72_05790 [Lachnospiraceae bacterium]|nr:hypothetical protein [Lachnospiraceae bacterium]